MIWPFHRIRALEDALSREEQLNTVLAATVSHLRAALEAERQDRRKLTDTIIELRRDGFQTPAKLDIPAEAEQLPPEVADAIREVAGPDSAEAKRLALTAADQLRAGREPATVAKDILRGEPFHW